MRLSKLFDRLKNAARARSGHASAVTPGGLLSQALQRAEAERAQSRSANDQMGADLDPRAQSDAAEREAERSSLAQADAQRRAETTALASVESERRLADALVAHKEARSR